MHSVKWVVLSSMIFFVSGFAFSTSTLDAPRPPQYVMLAFDGSKDINFWRESRQFAKEANVKFTYFISGVYFLSNGFGFVWTLTQNDFRRDLQNRQMYDASWMLLRVLFQLLLEKYYERIIGHLKAAGCHASVIYL